MSIASPRAVARNLQSVPQDWSDEREHLRLVSNAARQLQERSLRHPIEVVSTAISYTMTDDDLLVLGNASAGDIVVLLLTAASRKGRRIIVKKTDSSDNLVTIDPAGSETLDGATTVGLTQLNAAREYVSDGTNWQLVSAIGNANSL